MHPTMRPSTASGAVQLAYVTVGVTGAAVIAAVAQVATGDAGIQSWLLLLSLPGLVGLAFGAELLRRRVQRSLLVGSAIFSAVVAAATSLVGLVAYEDSVFVAFAAAPLLLVPLPVIAASLCGSRQVGEWLSGSGRQASVGPAGRPAA